MAQGALNLCLRIDLSWLGRFNFSDFLSLRTRCFHRASALIVSPWGKTPESISFPIKFFNYNSFNQSINRVIVVLKFILGVKGVLFRSMSRQTIEQVMRNKSGASISCSEAFTFSYSLLSRQKKTSTRVFQ